MPDEIAPDPTTNTAPSIGATSTPPGDWDYLDTSDDMLPGDPPETFDEPEAEVPEETPPVEDTPAVKGTGPEQADATKPVAEEKPVEEKPAEEAGIQQQQAHYFNEFDKALREDPTLVARAIVEGMDARQKAAFYRDLQGELPQAQTPFNAEAYEPQGEMEEALKSRWADLDAIPHLISETQAVEQRFNEAYGGLVPHISEANVKAEIALAKLEAIAEAVGVDLSDPDIEQIGKFLSDGKTSYRDAVRKAINYKPTVEEHKQKSAPRPRTPANESLRPEPIPEGTDMVTIARRLGTLRGR